MHAHSRWLNGITAIFGYLWLISGIDKIGSGVFVSGFPSFVADEYITKGTYSWYISFINAVVYPHAVLFGFLIEWGELAIGVVLLVGALWLFVRDSKVAHFFMAVANVGGAFLVANIIMAEGGSLLPFVDTSLVYEEGVSIDVIVMLVSLLVALANFVAFTKEWKDS
jgi:uncharacterized membrane protein YphA (DoxX/SURF4 family)